MAIGTALVGTVGSKASGTSMNVPYPTGMGGVAHRGLLVWGINSATEPTSAPAGWTFIAGFDTGSNTTPSLAVAHAALTGSESGNLAVSTPNVSSQGVILAYPGVDTTTPLDVAWNATTMKFERAAAALTFPIPGDTVVTDGAVAVSFVAVNNGTSTWTSDVGTELVDSQAQIPSLAVHEERGFVAGNNTALTFTQSTSVRGLAMQIILRPAPATEFSGWGVPI